MPSEPSGASDPSEKKGQRAHFGLRHQRIGGGGNADDLPILERLLLVLFVRSTYDFDPQVRETVARLLAANPSTSPEDLLKVRRPQGDGGNNQKGFLNIRERSRRA